MDKKIKVALVCGHTSGKQGASNTKYKMTEYKYNLELVTSIYKELHSKNCDILPMYFFRNNTQYINLPYEINEMNPDFTISFHCNAFNKNVSGSEFLYWHNSEKSKIIANYLSLYISDLIGKGKSRLFKKRGIKPIESQEERGGYLLKNTVAPCVIAETFFIDNNLDCYKAINHKQKIIDAYVNGIIEICKSQFDLKIKEENLNEIKINEKLIKLNDELKNIKSIKTKISNIFYKIIEDIEDIDDDINIEIKKIINSISEIKKELTK